MTDHLIHGRRTMLITLAPLTLGSPWFPLLLKCQSYFPVDHHNVLNIQIKQAQNSYKSNIQDGTAEVIFDQVKNFSHEVSRKKDSPGMFSDKMAHIISF